MGRSRYKIHDPVDAYFLTSTINGWIPIFMQPFIAEIIINALIFLQNKPDVELYGYCLMENHIHLVAQSMELKDHIRKFKSFTAHQIIRTLKSSGQYQLLRRLAVLKRSHKRTSNYQVWEEGSHPQQIPNERILKQKIVYMHMNPVRRGYIDEPEHWRYSSARNYAGGDGLVSVTIAF